MSDTGWLALCYETLDGHVESNLPMSSTRAREAPIDLADHLDANSIIEMQVTTNTYTYAPKVLMVPLLGAPLFGSHCRTRNGSGRLSI